MAKLTLTPNVQQQLLARGLQIHPSCELHLPLQLAPPIRLFGGKYTTNCQIDAFSYVSPNAILHSVTIGRYCSIGNDVAVLSNHPTTRLSTHPFTYESIFNAPFDQPAACQLSFSDKLATTTIGHDVWIGAGVRIKSGVNIGNGCIIGAGSLITKDIPAYTIVGGMPAKMIRQRFTPQHIERIERIQWWQYNLIGQTIRWHDIDASLDDIEALIAQGTLTPYNPQWIQLV